MVTQIFLFLFRLSHKVVSANRLIRFCGLPIRVFYKVWSVWVMRFELPDKVIVGNNLLIFHNGGGTVIHPKTIIGNNVSIRQNTTIGSKKIGWIKGEKAPCIGNNVHIGANVCIIGNITIGSNVIIGADSVVIGDVPSNCIVAGNPAKIIKRIEDISSPY